MARFPTLRYRTPVTSFIDLQGASGVVYRFRLAHPETLPDAGGNFVWIADPPTTGRVICCGTTRNLTKAATSGADAVAREGAALLYVRLNIARSARTGEHDDLVAGLRPPLVVVDPD